MNLGWLMSGRPGMGEILVIALLLIVFFGAKRLPELARSLGKSINEFKKGKAESAEDDPDSPKPESGEDRT